MLGIGELLRHEDRVVGGLALLPNVAVRITSASAAVAAGRVTVALPVALSTAMAALPDFHAMLTPAALVGSAKSSVADAGTALDSGLGLVEHLSVIQLGHVCGADGSVVYGVIVHVELEFGSA